MRLFKSSKTFQTFQMRVETFEDQIIELIKGIDLTSDAVKELNFDFKNLVSELNRVKHSDDDFHVGETVMDHMKMVLQNVNRLTQGWDEKKRNMMRLTAFLHDIAKPETFELRDTKATFYGHPDRGYAITKVLLTQFKEESEELRDYVAMLVKYHHSLYQLTDAKNKLKDPNQLSYLKGFIRAGLATEDSLKDLTTFAMADSMTPKALEEAVNGAKIITEDVKRYKAMQEAADQLEKEKARRALTKLGDTKALKRVLSTFLTPQELQAVLGMAPNLQAMNTALGKMRKFEAIKALKSYVS